MDDEANTPHMGRKYGVNAPAAMQFLASPRELRRVRLPP
jgi:hypothetical protein